MSIATGLPEAPAPAAPASSEPPSPIHPLDSFFRLSVEQYHAMIRLGTLTEDDPVELLEGWLVRKMPESPIHSLATLKVRRALDRISPDGFSANTQEPITAGGSEPEPDVLLIRGEPEQFREERPGPANIVILVEIAASSLLRDRGWKKAIYARFLVPEFWILNLIDRRVEVHIDPSGPAEAPDYRQRRDFGPEDEIPVVVDGREVGRIAVKDLLP